MRLGPFIEGNDAVQQHVAAEREKQALTAVSPLARRAIKEEILPQIEESVISIDSAEELCSSTKRSIEAAFSYKNEIYTRLIQYKTIDQSDQQFLADLLIVMDEWLRGMKARMEVGDDDASEATADTGKQEIEITVKVESEPEPVQLKDTSSGEEILVTPDDLFNLEDVRL